jgi:cephalosporin-C deacetylase-like acetyl esterase
MKMPVVFNPDLYAQPAAIYPANEHQRPGVQSLYFENEKYQTKETRVFAWLGMPYLPEGAHRPGMVLVHGGGGTAFDEWVRLWNGRGYAAIAVDLCGCQPATSASKEGMAHQQHDFSGPAGWNASFTQMRNDVTDHWQYHAITALLRAHTILANTKGVDPTRIGITGISWGGYITSLMMGIDPRYAAAIPVYGCGFITENSVWRDNGYDNTKAEDIKKWGEYWDPMHYLPNAKTPTLWVNGTNDFAYPLDSFKKSYSCLANPTISIGVEMGHSHGHGWAPREIHHFTDALFKGEAPLPEHIKTHIEDKRILATFTSVRPLMTTEICFTRASGMWQDRKWNTLPAVSEATAESYSIHAELPVGTTVAFINVWDDRGNCVSSPHIELA